MQSEAAVGTGLAQFELQHPAAITINTDGAFIDPVDTTHDDLNILLPNHDKRVSHVSIDIGGSLTKIVYFTKNTAGRGGRLHFISFETEKLDQWLSFLEQLAAQHPKDRPVRVVATGGGSYKYYDRIRSRLNVEVGRADEMECLIAGTSFFVERIPQEVFSYTDENPMVFSTLPGKYPYMLVNIGSGVSIIKVTGPQQFERIGGSSLGGGTLWGLLSQLTPANSYEEMLQIASTGDNRNVDMLVGDIYGSDYSRIGLKSSTIASSFGKVFKHRTDKFDPADISRSLLYAVSNNIGQLAYLHARYHEIEDIYFGGSYIRGHTQTIHTLAYAIKFWSKGEKMAYFFRHEGYLGAVGAFISQDGLIESPQSSPEAEQINN